MTPDVSDYKSQMRSRQKTWQLLLSQRDPTPRGPTRVQYSMWRAAPRGKGKWRGTEYGPAPFTRFLHLLNEATQHKTCKICKKQGQEEGNHLRPHLKGIGSVSRTHLTEKTLERINWKLIWFFRSPECILKTHLVEQHGDNCIKPARIAPHLVSTQMFLKASQGVGRRGDTEENGNSALINNQYQGRRSYSDQSGGWSGLKTEN